MSYVSPIIIFFLVMHLILYHNRNASCVLERDPTSTLVWQTNAKGRMVSNHILRYSSIYLSFNVFYVLCLWDGDIYRDKLFFHLTIFESLRLYLIHFQDFNNRYFNLWTCGLLRWYLSVSLQFNPIPKIDIP